MHLCCACGVVWLCFKNGVVKRVVFTVNKPVLNLVNLTFLYHAQEVTDADVATSLQSDLLSISVDF